MVSETLCALAPLLQHLIGFIQNKEFQFFQIEMPLLDHIKNPARRPTDHMDAHLQSLHILLHRLASDARVDLHIEMIAKGRGHLLALLGQFTSGRQDQDLRGPDARFNTL